MDTPHGRGRFADVSEEARQCIREFGVEIRARPLRPG
jgi:hypothetical protein